MQNVDLYRRQVRSVDEEEEDYDRKLFKYLFKFCNYFSYLQLYHFFSFLKF